MSMYAIIGVELFADFGADGTYTTVQQIGQGDTVQYPRTEVPSLTPRLFTYGQEYYGTFSRALFTNFQVLTGESWAEMIARPLVFGFDPANALGCAFFFSSF